MCGGLYGLSNHCFRTISKRHNLSGFLFCSYSYAQKAADKIVDETIDTFDELISKINKKGIDNKKAHLKAVNAELEEKAGKLLKKINKLD